jgi:mono/diheme cytochrome c family protein
MQVKVVIGTIAFMLTMIILGFAALLEPARMERYTLAYEGRRIEQGAEVYKTNCASCHGVEGDAQFCPDPATGDQIACAGRPLNTAELLCGIPTPRMEAMAWLGSKYDFIEGTVAVGRPWAGMPTWGQEYGGPLQPNQVENVTLFVLNWESVELCAEPVEVREWPPIEELDDFLAEFPGDPVAGEAIYNNPTAACVACHGTIDDPQSARVGPHLGQIGTVGADRITGYTAAQYIYESILYPEAFLAPQCPSDAGPVPCPNAMPGHFGNLFDYQEIADLVTFLLEQE